MNEQNSLARTSPVLKIGLDTSALHKGFKEHATRGIGRYVSELKKYFDSQKGSDLEIGTFDHETISRVSKTSQLVSKVSEFLPYGKRTLNQQILYPLNLGKKSIKDNFDILHFPAHMDAPSWGSSRCVVTVLDLIPLVLPELYKAEQPGWRFNLARSLEIRAIKHAELLLAISDTTKRDVVKLLGIEPERIVVTPLGVDKSFFDVNRDNAADNAAIRKKLGLSENKQIILYVGGIDPRKNVAALLNSFKIIEERNPTKTELVVAGQITQDRQYPKFIKLIKDLGLTSNVVTPGFISDSDLRLLMGASSVLFFPSLYEGFGLPPLEAMAAGLPVVSSNSSCLPDILGNAALMVDPQDYRGQANALEYVLTNLDIHKELASLGKIRAQNFTWKKTGEATLKAYERFIP